MSDSEPACRQTGARARNSAGCELHVRKFAYHIVHLDHIGSDRFPAMCFYDCYVPYVVKKMLREAVCHHLEA